MSATISDLKKSSHVEHNLGKASVRVVPALLDFKWDYAALVQASLTDTWTFKEGGSGGTTRGVLVITYTDSGKGTISTVERTT